MAPKLYEIDLSPPVRGSLLAAEALGIELEHHEVDFFNWEHLQPEYLKMNPQHTVPMLEDDGKIIWDSHAINIYLLEKYGKDDSLYPKDPYKRGIVNQRLFFDAGVVHPALLRVIRPINLEGAKIVAPDAAAAATEAFDFLEKFLEGRQWVAGDFVSLADLSLVASVTTIDIVLPVDPEKYPNITAWIERAKKWPYYHANEVGLEKFRIMLAEKMSG